MAFTLSQLKALAKGAKNVFLSKEFSDLVISCKGEEWRVHKLWVCLQSSFLHSACTKGFKEATENKITLDDDDPSVVGQFIHYLYHFDYDDNSSPLPANQMECPIAMSMNIQMFVLADKYFVEPLQKLAAQKFDTLAKTAWSTPDFASAIAEVYGSTLASDENPIRRTILDNTVAHFDELLDKKNGEYKHFHTVLGEVAEFGKDVAIALRDSVLGEKVYQCPECEIVFKAPSHADEFSCPGDCYPGFRNELSVHKAIIIKSQD